MVAKLVAIDGPEKGLELILEKGESWIIGRDPKECDFILEDPKVSRRHAQIRLHEGQYFIKNFSRTNPVHVGDEQLRGEKALQFNETLKIGESQFRFSEIKASKSDHTKDYDQLFEDIDEPPIDIHPDDDTSDRAEEDSHYDTIFQDIGDEDTYGDFSDSYTGSERFVLKVLSGPNTGAEFSMQKGRSYVIGTDVTGADIIFNDLSVSRHHARISVTDDLEIVIEDLDSRNGIMVDDEQIQGQKILTSKNLVTLGTTSFVVIDRESGEETIVTPLPKMEEHKRPVEEIVEPIEKEPEPASKNPFKTMVSESTFILTGILIAFILVLGTGAVLLFKSSPVERLSKDYTHNIESILGHEFPDVKFTFNPGDGSVFLVGHVLTSVEKEELLYKLNNLAYISNIDDNVVIDEFVTGEMNQILSRNPYWEGINVHAPKPGQFVISGYLPTRQVNAELDDYMNVQFPYVDRLTNYIVVEEDLYQEIISKLHNYGFYNVKVDLSNGETTFTGYVNYSFEKAFEQVVREVARVNGVRRVNDYVVIVGKSTSKTAKDLLNDPSVINLTDYTNAYSPVTQNFQVTGYAQQNGNGKAVEINGQIIAVGDQFSGMKVIAILKNFVFLEKNGLKYKIEYIK